MRILVIGGTGFISGKLVEKLIERGHRTTVITRGLTAPAGLDGTKVRFLVADRRNERVFADAVKREMYDAVFDMIAYDPTESEQAASFFRGRVGRFIHCSTISVYMVSKEVQCPIAEDQDKTPLMDYFPRNPFGMDYGIKKRRCEEVLWKVHDEKTFPVSILRPTYVCGPGDPTKRDFFWIERILDDGPLLVPGSGDYAFQSVFVDDVGEAFASLLEVPQSIGQAYNVASEEIFSLNEYLHLLSRMLKKTPELVHVDQEVFDSLPLSVSKTGDVFPFNTRRTAVFDLEKIKNHLGYRSTPFREWIVETINWYEKKFKGHSNGYERRAEEISVAIRWKQVTRKMGKEIRP